MKINENKNLKKISPLEILNYQIPSDEEVHFNKINNIIERHLIYAKALSFMPRSLAKAISFKNIEISMFDKMFKLYFTHEKISEKEIDKLANVLNASFAKTRFAKLIKSCITAEAISCNVFIPLNAVAHLYSIAYIIDDYLRQNKNLSEFEIENFIESYHELYERGKIYSTEI